MSTIYPYVTVSKGSENYLTPGDSISHKNGGTILKSIDGSELEIPCSYRSNINLLTKCRGVKQNTENHYKHDPEI